MLETEFIFALLVLVTIFVSVVRSNRFGWLLFLLMVTTFILCPIMLLGVASGPSSPSGPSNRFEDILTTLTFFYVLITGVGGLVAIIASAWYKWLKNEIFSITILKYALSGALVWLSLLTYFLL